MVMVMVMEERDGYGCCALGPGRPAHPEARSPLKSFSSLDVPWHDGKSVS